jgi:hypothetical protein
MPDLHPGISSKVPYTPQEQKVKNPIIKELQNKLNKFDELLYNGQYQLMEDGIYGPKTAQLLTMINSRYPLGDLTNASLLDYSRIKNWNNLFSTINNLLDERLKSISVQGVGSKEKPLSQRVQQTTTQCDKYKTNATPLDVLNCLKSQSIYDQETGIERNAYEWVASLVDQHGSRVFDDDAIYRVLAIQYPPGRFSADDWSSAQIVKAFQFAPEYQRVKQEYEQIPQTQEEMMAFLKRKYINNTQTAYSWLTQTLGHENTIFSAVNQFIEASKGNRTWYPSYTPQYLVSFVNNILTPATKGPYRIM